MRKYADFSHTPSPKSYQSTGAKFKRIIQYRRSPRLVKKTGTPNETAYKAASLIDVHTAEVEAVIKYGHIKWLVTPSDHWFSSTVELSTWEARKFIEGHMSVYLVLLRGSDKKHYDRLLQRNRSLAKLAGRISAIKLEPDTNNDPVFSGEFLEDFMPAHLQ